MRFSFFLSVAATLAACGGDRGPRCFQGVQGEPGPQGAPGAVEVDDIQALAEAIAANLELRAAVAEIIA